MNLPASEVLAVGLSGAVVGFGINPTTGLVDVPITPSRVIGGGLNPGSWQGVSAAYGIAVRNRGEFYVTNQGVASPPSVTLFAKNADGATAMYDIHTGTVTTLGKPWGIAYSPNKSLFVANNPVTPGQGTSTVLEFERNASSNVPITSLSGSAMGVPAPSGIAFDSQERLLVADASTNSVNAYLPVSNNPTRVRESLKGSQTLLERPLNIAVSSSELYVVNQPTRTPGTGYITVYPVTADGDVPPTRVLGRPFTGGGPATHLQRPTAVAVHATGNLYVADGDAVLVFAAGAANNDAPQQRLTHPKLADVTAVAVRDP